MSYFGSWRPCWNWHPASVIKCRSWTRAPELFCDPCLRGEMLHEKRNPTRRAQAEADYRQRRKE